MTVPARTNTTTAAEVPTTKDVRTGYALSKLNGQGFIDAADVLDGASAAFDRWLAAHDAQVRAEAWAAGAAFAISHPTWRAVSIRAANPHRIEREGGEGE